MRIRARRADGHEVSINLWHRATTAVRERYRASAPALYGAGLHTGEDDGPTIVVPAPRRESASPVAARVEHPASAASR